MYDKNLNLNEYNKKSSIKKANDFLLKNGISGTIVPSEGRESKDPLNWVKTKFKHKIKENYILEKTFEVSFGFETSNNIVDPTEVFSEVMLQSVMYADTLDYDQFYEWYGKSKNDYKTCRKNHNKVVSLLGNKFADFYNDWFNNIGIVS